MPNSRATTMPGCARRSGCPSRPVATSPMLRASRGQWGHPQALGAGHQPCSRSRRRLRNVSALPYGCAVDPCSPADPPRPASGAALSVSGPADFGPAGDPPSALSPSRAADFMTCPLLYRFRVIDRIPEPPTPATARGTLVHAVLERLFDRPAAERVPAVAADMVEPEWQRLCEENAGLAELLPDEEERARFIADAHAALTGYFKLEDPRRLEPAER